MFDPHFNMLAGASGMATTSSEGNNTATNFRPQSSASAASSTVSRSHDYFLFNFCLTFCFLISFTINTLHVVFYAMCIHVVIFNHFFLKYQFEYKEEQDQPLVLKLLKI